MIRQTKAGCASQPQSHERHRLNNARSQRASPYGADENFYSRRQAGRLDHQTQLPCQLAHCTRASDLRRSTAWSCRGDYLCCNAKSSLRELLQPHQRLPAPWLAANEAAPSNATLSPMRARQAAPPGGTDYLAGRAEGVHGTGPAPFTAAPRSLLTNGPETQKCMSNLPSSAGGRKSWTPIHSLTSPICSPIPGVA